MSERNKSTEDRFDSEVLIQRFLDGTLHGSEADRLLEILRGDPAEVRRLARQADFDAELRQWCLDGLFLAKKPEEEESTVNHEAATPFPFLDTALFSETLRSESVSSSVVDAVPDPPVSFPDRFPRWNISPTWINRLIVLDVLAIAAILVLMCLPVSRTGTQTLPEKGRLLGFHEVRWQSEPIWDTSGFGLLSDRLTTLSGHVAFKLENGIDVLLDGATDLQILSAGHLACHRGRLSLDVPPQPQPFRVKLPQYTIVVLGTAFDVRVDGDGSTIHLKKGRVSIEGLPSSPFYLEAGGALTVSPTMEVKSFAASSEAAPLFSEIENKTKSRLDSWRQQSQQLKDDPATVVFMGFERSSMNRELRGRLNWTQGPFPGKWALRFPKPEDDLFLPLNKNYSKATVMAWIRRESTNDRRNAFFFTDSVRWEFSKSGGLCWQPKGEETHDSMPIPVDVAGSWNHVAVVVDGPGKIVRHYLNGKEVFTEPASANAISGAGARLGGGVAAAEFLFSERLYSAEEIEQIHNDKF